MLSLGFRCVDRVSIWQSNSPTWTAPNSRGTEKADGALPGLFRVGGGGFGFLAALGMTVGRCGGWLRSGGFGFLAVLGMTIGGRCGGWLRGGNQGSRVRGNDGGRAGTTEGGVGSDGGRRGNGGGGCTCGRHGPPPSRGIRRGAWGLTGGGSKRYQAALTV